jgi:hypothetical protein
MTTKKEAAATLAEKGIALPDNWSKLSTERALAWAGEAMLGVKPKRVGRIAHGVSALMGALAAAGAAVVEAVTPAPADKLDKAARKNAELKVFSDPTYRKTTNKMRRMMARYRRVGRAADPVPMTRQVARRKALDAGLKASEFRRFMGA